MRHSSSLFEDKFYLFSRLVYKPWYIRMFNIWKPFDGKLWLAFFCILFFMGISLNIVQIRPEHLTRKRAKPFTNPLHILSSVIRLFNNMMVSSIVGSNQIILLTLFIYYRNHVPLEKLNSVKMQTDLQKQKYSYLLHLSLFLCFL